MENFQDLVIILKNFQYGERDRIAVFLSEHHGKVTGLAKGGVHSKRFGGSLGFLSVSQVRWVKKAHKEMVRIEEAHQQHEFTKIPQDFFSLSVASLMAEFYLKVLEADYEVRDLFVILSNGLFQLNQGRPPLLALNAFFAKSLTVLGYAPGFSQCGSCQSRNFIHEENTEIFWNSELGSLICKNCIGFHKRSIAITEHEILNFSYFLATPFKELVNQKINPLFMKSLHLLFRILTDFSCHHIPALKNSEGLKTLRVLDEDMLQAAEINP